MATAVRRHGALLCEEHGLDTTELVALPTFTRRGAREAYDRLQRQMMNRPALDGASECDDAMLVATRIEQGRIVERVRIPFGGGGDPDAGVREPRRPRPEGPSTSASAACS